MENENENENEREKKNELKISNDLNFKLDLSVVPTNNSQTTTQTSPHEKKKKYGISIKKKKKEKEKEGNELKSPKPKRKLFSARGSHITPKEICESLRKPSSDNLSLTERNNGKKSQNEQEKSSEKEEETKNNNENKEEDNSIVHPTIEIREGRSSAATLQKRKSIPKIFSDNMKKKITTKLSSSTNSSTSSNVPKLQSSSSAPYFPPPPSIFFENSVKKAFSDQLNDSSSSSQVQFDGEVNQVKFKENNEKNENLTNIQQENSNFQTEILNNDEKIVFASMTRITNGENEISVVVGDRMKAKLPPIDGWCFVEVDGKSGYVPLSVSNDLLLLSNCSLEREVDTSSLITSKEENKTILKKNLEARPHIENLIEKNILTTNSSSLSPTNSPEVSGQMIDNSNEMIEENAIKLFSEKPHKAIELLIEHKIIERTANSVANYLFTTSSLSREMIGDYLGDRGDFYTETLLAYLDHLSFKDMEFDKALRLFLYTFKLPGESQKIDRIMEAFAKKYFDQYSGNVFAHEDTVYILAYATIMLNTDLHNIYVKKKMTSAEFVNNNRDINQGKNLPLAFLQDLYQRILEDEIKTKNAEIFPKAVKRGYLNVKKGKGKEKKLWIILDKESNHLYTFKLETETTPMHRYNLHYLTVIQQESTIRRVKKNFTILLDYIDDGRTMRLILSTPSQRLWVEWLTCISDIIEEANKNSD